MKVTGFTCCCHPFPKHIASKTQTKCVLALWENIFESYPQVSTHMFNEIQGFLQHQVPTHALQVILWQTSYVYFFSTSTWDETFPLFALLKAVNILILPLTAGFICCLFCARQHRSDQLVKEEVAGRFLAKQMGIGLCPKAGNFSSPDKLNPEVPSSSASLSFFWHTTKSLGLQSYTHFPGVSLTEYSGT